MNSVYKNEIMPRVHLTCVTTRKFKTGLFSVNFISPLQTKTVSYHAVLPYVLLRGTALHPDMDSLMRVQEELYGVDIQPIVRKRGEDQCFGLRATFADDDFLPKGEQILEKTAALLGEILLQPETRGGRLLGEYVESEKENLIQRIRAEVNNKKLYAYTRLCSLMCAGEPFGVGRMGTEATASKITLGTLTKHYRQTISRLPMEIIYIGAATPQRVEAALLEALAPLPREETEETAAKPKEYKKKEIRTFRESMKVNQGNLVLGFRIDPKPSEVTVPALMVLNTMFGSGVSSRLFANVREKLSLCYYAYSWLEERKGLLLVSSGIAFDKYQQALDEILHQFKGFGEGDFTAEEMAGAINTLSAELQLQEDDFISQELFYLNQALLQSSQTPSQLAAAVGRVTPEQVQKAAQMISLDSVYFLTGQEEEYAI